MIELKERPAAHKTVEENTASVRPYEIDKTKAAIKKTVDDINLFCRIYGIFVQLVFIAYYVYALITSLHGGHLLIINAIMLATVTLRFMFDVCTFRKQDDTRVKKFRRNFSKTFRYIGHTVHIVTVTFAIYAMLTFDNSEIKIITTMIAVASIALQIIFEIIRIIFDKYFNLIVTGIEMDIEEFKASALYKTAYKVQDTAKNFPASVIELIDKPIEALANKMSASRNSADSAAAGNQTAAETAEEYAAAGETPTNSESENAATHRTKKEKATRKLLYDLSDKKHAEDAIKKAKKKEETKKAEDERLQTSVGKLKSHVKSIFKKDD